MALSTLFTRQRSVADDVPELDRRLAPYLAWCAAGVVGLGLAAIWVAYQLGAVI